jgi:ditrans,polycis-polyprenyl diphosphate synthase
MSWIRNEELKLSWFENLAIKVIKQGPIPRHIAFIMDGNRRWATKFNLNKSEGHKFGFDKLSEALQW